MAPKIIRVNLLDWRAKRRERRKKQFAATLGAAVLAGAAVTLAIVLAFQAQLNQQDERNEMLRKEIKAMEVKIKEIKDLEKVREDLVARTEVIEKLQHSRAETVHFFDDLASTVPDGVYLTRITQRGTDAQIDGVAESNGRVSTYIRQLEAAQWLHNPRLVFIRAANRDNRRMSEFSIRARVGEAKAPRSEEAFD